MFHVKQRVLRFPSMEGITAARYLDPDLPNGLRALRVPLVEATPDALRGYGEIVRDPQTHRIEIVPWPAPGRRPLDPGTGDEAGTTEGIFACAWRDGILRGRNEAVSGDYVLGYRDPPGAAPPRRSAPRVLLWHANYHPDGGQLFWPLDGRPFVVPAALPGDEVRPGQFVAFRSDGSFGLYIHPSIW